MPHLDETIYDVVSTSLNWKLACLHCETCLEPLMVLLSDLEWTLTLRCASASCWDDSPVSRVTSSRYFWRYHWIYLYSESLSIRCKLTHFYIPAFEPSWVFYTALFEVLESIED
jgi:hypothetical protein